MTQDSPSIRFAAIVLAAGKSTRMRSKTPKALHSIAGKPVLAHILDALKAAGASRIVIVVGHQSELLRTKFGNDYEYVEQAEQRGTGHAARMAQPALADWDGPVIIVPGDSPLITDHALIALLEQHRDGHATMLTVNMANPKGYGRVLRADDGTVTRVIEEKDASDEQRRLTEVCVSIYAFSPTFMFSALEALSPNNKQGEYYLTDTIGIAAERNLPVSAMLWPNPEVGLGINDRVQLAEAAALLRNNILRRHMEAGVTIVDPGSTWIDAAVKIGADTVIQPFTLIHGVTDIGEDCVIGPGARVTDSVLGNGVTVKDSHITSSEVGDGTTIGPFANLRPASMVGKNVKIGDFVETKQATIGDHVSAGHFAYLGNTTIGENTNVGAGTITCNYDGVNKHETSIGANAFIGSNSTLVAPVTIGDGAYIAAGSTITDEVPAGALGIGRSRQSVKPGWAATRKKPNSKSHKTT